MYGTVVISSRDCVECSYIEYGELCFECTDIYRCYNCHYSQELKNCTDCSFCFDCIGCQNCFGSSGLRQKQYCFNNEQLSKEEYTKRVADFMKQPDALERGKALFEEAKQKIPHRAANLLKSENCTGNNVIESRNCFECYDVHESDDCMYMQDVWRTKDSADMTFSDGSELCYEDFSLGMGSYNCNFSSYIRTCSDVEYCELVFSCKNCFGCVGLQNKEYYILNKPYQREEYFKKVAEIKAQMKRDGTYGKHLPSTYKFEDTAAATA